MGVDFLEKEEETGNFSCVPLLSCVILKLILQRIDVNTYFRLISQRIKVRIRLISRLVVSGK
jgi:hypothetical protein